MECIEVIFLTGLEIDLDIYTKMDWFLYWVCAYLLLCSFRIKLWDYWWCKCLIGSWNHSKFFCKCTYLFAYISWTSLVCFRFYFFNLIVIFWSKSLSSPDEPSQASKLELKILENRHFKTFENWSYCLHSCFWQK